MQYTIIGAGGTGGVVGYFMTKAGKDVTLIARGRHLEAMKEHGLTLERLWDPNPETIAVKATDMKHYKEQPDVIPGVCKRVFTGRYRPVYPSRGKTGYDRDSDSEYLWNRCKTAKELPELLVTDGCIYVSANIKRTGCVSAAWKDSADRLWVGKDRLETGTGTDPAGILRTVLLTGILSENIRREALEKFSYVSPIGAAGLYCNAVAGIFRRGAPRETVLFDDPGNRSTCRCYGRSVSKRHGRC